jgi:hypothetical protein
VKRALLAAIGAVGLFAAPARAQDRYVPTGMWEDENQAAFYERWFGDQLRAMGEPTLRSASDRGRFTRRLRVLILPSFEPAYALRIDESGSGGAVTFVKLDGRGGYAPGRVAVRRHYRLTPGEMRDVSELLRRYRFNAMPVRSPEEAVEDDPAKCPNLPRRCHRLRTGRCPRQPFRDAQHLRRGARALFAPARTAGIASRPKRARRALAITKP